MRDLQAIEVAFMRTQDKGMCCLFTEVLIIDKQQSALLWQRLANFCSVSSSPGEADNLQAKQSSASRTMAADFTSCRAEPSSLLICFLQFLPQTAASHPRQVDSCNPLNHTASVSALLRPHTFRKKGEKNSDDNKEA